MCTEVPSKKFLVLGELNHLQSIGPLVFLTVHLIPRYMPSLVHLFLPR